MAKKKNKSTRDLEASCSGNSNLAIHKASSNKGALTLSKDDLTAIDLICIKSFKRFLQNLSPEQLKAILVSSNYSKDKPLPEHLRLENLVSQQYQEHGCHLLKEPKSSEPKPLTQGGHVTTMKNIGSQSKRRKRGCLTVAAGDLPSSKAAVAYACEWPGCKTRRASLANLRAHMNVHLETFKCTVCKKCFESPSHLRLHYVCHETLRPFACNVCGRAFKLETPLMVHVRRLHSNEEKSFKCPDCGASAWTYQNICQHRVSMHHWNWRNDEAS